MGSAGWNRVRAVAAARAAALRAGRPVDAHRWAHRAVVWAVRLATLAAGLCPALASVGGSIVAALLTATGWWVARDTRGTWWSAPEQERAIPTQRSCRRAGVAGAVDQPDGLAAAA